MNRLFNSKSETQTIYEIFRACRLCGAGGGYKMPIIQNVVDLDDTEIELKQKIKECVQIEVDIEDKMPPLICELCIDKVNDFYEFLAMCRQTNQRTRMRLGLPLKTRTQGGEDCILGVTEPVFANDDSEDEPLAKPEPKGKSLKKKKPEMEKQLVVKIEKPTQKALPNKQSKPLSRKRVPSPSPLPPTYKPTPLSRKLRAHSPTPPSSRRTRRSPTPPLSRRLRVTSPSPPRRVTRNVTDDDVKPLRSLQTETSNSSKSRKPEVTKVQKGALKKDPWPVEREKEKEPKLDEQAKAKKRPMEKEFRQSPLPAKKVKISAPPKPSPPKPAPMIVCNICSLQLKNTAALTNHLRSHHANYITPKLACNACALWFASGEEAHAHHKTHRAASAPYACHNCGDTFDNYNAFNEHHESNVCDRYFEFPDVKCSECLRTFPTWTLRDQHKCLGVDGRPGGKCSKCRRNYALLKNLTKHESTCTAKRRGQLIIDPEVMREIRPAQIVTARCDPLLASRKDGHVDVSKVRARYGLDVNRHYPYFNTSLRVKTDPDGMVNITDEILDYVHWDSDYTSDGDITSMDSGRSKPVDSLTSLTLKVIFSNKFLGKLPKKRRKKIKVEKVKTEDFFDSMLNVDMESEFSGNIDNIISTLDSAWEDDDAGEKSILRGIMDISMPDFASEKVVDKVGEVVAKDGGKEDVASDFDKLFGSGKSQEKNSKSMDLIDNIGDKVEKIDSTNDSNVKSSEINEAMKGNNEVTEKMNVDDETNNSGVDSNSLSDVTPGIDTKIEENGKDNVQSEVINDDINKITTPIDATSLVELTESESRAKDLPESVKSTGNLLESETVGDDIDKDVNNVDGMKNGSADNTDDRIENNKEIERETEKQNSVDKAGDDTEADRVEQTEQTSHNYVESQTYTENFDIHFKKDEEPNPEEKHAAVDTTTNDTASELTGKTPEIPKTNDNHQNYTTSPNKPKSESKSDDFSIVNILKPVEHVKASIETLNRPTESTTTVSNGGNENNVTKNMTDSEIEDKKLMDELNAQIGETEDIINGKSVTEISECSKQEKSANKDTALDLDNVSDDEFNFDT